MEWRTLGIVGKGEQVYAACVTNVPGFEDKQVALPLDNAVDAPGPFQPKRYLRIFETCLDYFRCN